MAWLYLLLAILFEVSGTTCMKLSDGFQNILPSIAIFIFYGLSITSLTLAVKTIDISIAYAIWCALGMIIISFIGIFFFSESANLWKMASIAVIIIGVVGLKLSETMAT